MFHVYTLTSEALQKITAIGISPGPLPDAAKAGDTLTMLHSFETLDAAETYKRQLIMHWKIERELVVLCEQTGQTFPTAYAAAKATGVAQSALSNHLAGKIGYRTVKGLTFRKMPRP